MINAKLTQLVATKNVRFKQYANSDPAPLGYYSFCFIPSELSGIYNRILQAYDVLTSNNYIFSESEASEKSLEEFKYSNSTYNQFVDDILEKTESEDDFMSSTEIMDAYNRWAIANNVSYRPTLVKLVRELGLMGVLGQEKRAYINGVRQRGFSKIRRTI